MHELSILIPAYRARHHIHECLDSIYTQQQLDSSWSVEVLLGIDGCRDTLECVQEMAGRYPGLRVLWMEKNMGAYVTRNTLAQAARGNWFLFFDADDIMKQGMLVRLAKQTSDGDLFMYYCERFKPGDDTYKEIILHHGSFLIRKELFELMGGFLDWPCAADTEFLSRLHPEFKRKSVIAALFYYRVHKDSLTQNPETGMDSLKRKLLARRIKNQYEKINPVVNSFEELNLLDPILNQ